MDCSQLHEKDLEGLKQMIEKTPDIVIGELSDNDWATIGDTVKDAFTISPKQKRKYGLIP